MPLDFPINPVNGQIFEGFIYDASIGSWEGTSNVLSLSSRLSAIESRVPAGTLHQWTLPTVPQGYLLCNGQEISRTDFASLFAAIGTTCGVGNGSTTFNVPDLRGNVPVGRSISGIFSTNNNKGGTESVTLSLTQIPSHTHIQNEHNHTQNEHNHSQNAHNHIFSENALLVSGYAGFAQTSPINGNGFDISANSSGFTTATNNPTTATNQPATATNQNTGGGLPHNNLQPYIALNYIIKT